jgi:DNA polymerase delta subunit 1
VLDPVLGFHKKPVVCLDFNSLYPSEGMAHNICYTTYVTPQDALKMDPKDVWKSPAGHYFVRKHVKEGILPRIWASLLAARNVAKGDMKKCKVEAKETTDKDKTKDAMFRYSVQDARQAAIKLVANAMYGFTGVGVKFGPMLTSFEVSESITACGRDDLRRIRAWVIEHYTYATIIYGGKVVALSLVVSPHRPDTDSLMVMPGCETVKEAMAWMHKVAAEINEELYKDLKPMKLAPEKVMYPSEFQGKKHYVCGYYETNPDVPDKVYYRGIEVARRDNCDMTSKCLTECCELIFLKHRVADAVQVAKDAVERLYLQKVGMEDLIISKSLSDEPENYTMAQAHTRLAEKMAKRDPTSAPVKGDRISYVMVGEGVKGGVRELAEDPLWALEKEIPINVDYYIKNQLQKPLERLFEPIVGARRTADIFSGPHTMKRVKIMSKKEAGGIMAFAVMMRACSECHTQYNPEIHAHPSLCPACVVTHGAEVLTRKRKRYEEVKSEYDVQFAVCQKCQGSSRDPVLCTARSCPQLYRRKGIEYKCKRALGDIEDMVRASGTSSSPQ